MSTERYGLVGRPIGQSPSPDMHNAAFQALGLDAIYELFQAGPEDLAAVLDGLERGRWQGLNVTTPLKTLMAAHVRLRGDAARAGACNTVWRKGQKLVGALTDVEGVRAPLVRSGLSGGLALVLGAGGAARAAVLALESLVDEICVASRRPEQAAQLLDHLQPSRPCRAEGLSSLAKPQPELANLRVIVQATPVGRQGDRHNIAWQSLATAPIAFDMVYKPVRTPFLCDAEAHGCTVIEGWQMLLEQGASSFKLFTGQEPPRPVMQRALALAL